MDLVLGFSVTSTAIRFVLVEGADGDGATVDSGTLDLAAVGSSGLNSLVGAVLGEGPYAAVPGVRPVAVGVTWSPVAAGSAESLLAALADRGVVGLVEPAPSEAAAALATGICELADQDEIAVCIVEPDLALVTVVTTDRVIVDPIPRTDPVTVAREVQTSLEETGARPQALYVLGSAGHLPAVTAALDHPAVISAAEADLALARGAALASARGFAGADAALASIGGHAGRRRSRLTWRVPALTSVLAAAVVTFVVSLSVALGLQLTAETRPDSAQPEQLASASGQIAKEPAAVLTPRAPEVKPLPAAPPPPPAAPPPPPPEVLPAPEPELAPIVEPVYDAPEVAPAPAPEFVAPPAPAFVPPAPAYVPPAPAYTPPASGAPAYVPPQTPGYVPPVSPQPRLRDRIIERLPIINRFHEPEYQTP